jgi:hypothetical protein
VAHAFTGASVNLSTTSGPDAETAADSRRSVCAALGLAADKLVQGRQVHGIHVARVDGNPAPRIFAGTDGLVTTERGVPLLALSADCPLIVLVDPAAGALGMAHSGWRGTVAGMPRRLASALLDECGANPQRIVAVVSPCAGPSAYEIRDDVRTQLQQAMGDAEPYLACKDGRIFLNLPKLIAAQLTSAGISAANIHLPEQCTIQDTRFHSYRRNGPNTGHAALIVGLL